MRLILSLRMKLATALFLLLAGASAQAADPADHVYDVAPSIVSFHSNGRGFSLVFGYDVREKLPPGSCTFVHFTRDGDILLYMGDSIESSPENWPVGQVIKGHTVWNHFPPVLADGNYPILVGIFTPVDGKRLLLKGIDDGQHRYVAGILSVADHGRKLSLIGAPPIGADAPQK